jgi:hypothetical protein
MAAFQCCRPLSGLQQEGLMLSSLPKEVLAVLRNAPNLEPCEKFRTATDENWAEHLKDGKCAQCIALYLQWDKELSMMRFLIASRN